MIKPGTEAELAETIATAQGAFQIEGGGTRPIGRPVFGQKLSLSELAGIELYDPGALTLVARAGTPVSEIEKALIDEGQQLAFEPLDHRALLGTKGTPTIGGVFAANVSGPRRFAVGAARDFLLGVRLIDGQGRILKNGGRVMKNVTGYDLVKLMAGSWGTLGALTEVAFKVLPLPETVATLTLETSSPAEAVAAMTTAINTPFEVTGAVAGPFGNTAAPIIYLRVEGLEKSVNYRVAELSKRLAKFGDVATDLDANANHALWKQLRDKPMLSKFSFVTSSAVKPSAAPDLMAAFDRLGVTTHYLDWGGGMVWSGVQAREEAGQTIGAMQKAAVSLNAHTTLIKADEALRKQVPSFQPENPIVAKLSEGLRAKFDPRGILNPKRMI